MGMSASCDFWGVPEIDSLAEYWIAVKAVNVLIWCSTVIVTCKQLNEAS